MDPTTTTPLTTLATDRLGTLVRGARTFAELIASLEIKNAVARLDALGLVREATNKVAVEIINEDL